MRGQMRVRRVGSAAGMVLTGLGMFFLYKDLAGVADKISHLLGGNGSGGLQILPAAAVVAPHLTQATCFMQHTLLACWPLLLVTVGTMLSRGHDSEKAEILSEK